MYEIDKDNKRKKFKWIFLSLSLLFHAGLLFWTIKGQETMKLLSKSRQNKKEPKHIRIVLNKKKQKSEKKRQIVETLQKKPVKKVDNAKFLGKSNQEFLREMVAKTNGSHKSAGKGVRNGKNKKSQSVKQNLKVVTQKKSFSKKKTKKVARKKIALADIAVGQMEIFKKQDKVSAQKAIAKGLKNGQEGQRGLAQNNDFIEDIPLGDMTNLNTKEFKYYGFYHRIKMQLEQHWGRSLQEKVRALYKSGRKIASVDNRITSLVITLDGRGSIRNIEVKGTSGVKALDDAAIESFSKAGPFPNPPSGMVKNGVAVIEWGFVVKS